MPDRRPDADEVGEAPNSGGRRSGLDRLRAARGTAPTEERTPGGDRPTAAETTAGGAGGSGSTALLETAEPSVAATTDGGATATDATADLPAAGEGASTARRSRLRRRRTATTAAGRRKRGTARPVGAAQGRASRAQIIAAVVLILLVIGLLVPVILMRHRVFGESKEQKQITDLVEKRTEALSTARRFGVTFFSTDYKTIDQYSDQVAAMSTGQFQKDFNDKRAQLKSLLTQVQTQATGTVLSAGVSKVSGNDAEVLLIVDQQAKNTTTQGKTTTTRYRVRVSLQKSPKGWLVTNLEPVI